MRKKRTRFEYTQSLNPSDELRFIKEMVIEFERTLKWLRSRLADLEREINLPAHPAPAINKPAQSLTTPPDRADQ